METALLTYYMMQIMFFHAVSAATAEVSACHKRPSLAFFVLHTNYEASGMRHLARHKLTLGVPGGVKLFQ